MTFTTVNLTNEQVLVKGTDRLGTEGQTVLDASVWNEVKRHKAFHSATETFDTTVEEFFAPLMKAQEELEEAFRRPAPDPITYVVLNEGVEATPGTPREVIKLDDDGIVLRLIEAGETDRLVWVMDRLAVVAVEEVPAQAEDTRPEVAVDDDPIG